jgi:hypothetical protein
MLVEPAYITPIPPQARGSYGPHVSRWFERKLDMKLGAWQDLCMERLLLHGEPDELLTREALFSVARQNGKTVLARALVGWIMDVGYRVPAFEEWKYIMLAGHDAKQARIPYSAIRADLLRLDSPTVGRHVGSTNVKRVVRATYWHGLERNGVMVSVATSKADSARGQSAGLIGFDEVLTQTQFEMYAALRPALSAIRNSQLVSTSTAGYYDSVVLRSLWDRTVRLAVGAEQADPSFCGIIWQCDDDDVSPEDLDRLQMANPALFDGRLSIDSIRGEFAIMPHGNWVRERLNRWSDERVDAPFSVAAWGNCREAEPLHPAVVSGKYVLAVDVEASWAEGAIIVAAPRMDGRVGVEVHRRLLGTPGMNLRADMFIAEIHRLCDKLDVQGIYFLHSSALAPSLERDSVASGLPYESVPSTRMLEACHDLAEAVQSKRIAHDDPYLDTQVASGNRRYVGKEGQWRWITSITPVNGLVAATLAISFAPKPLAPAQVFL